MLVRLGIFLLFIALIYLTQRFWFLGAWQKIGTLTHPAVRLALQVSWFVALLVFVVSFFDPVLGHFFSRATPGKWLVAAARIWLFASLVAFLGVKLVGALGWISNAAASLFPAKHARFDPARRLFFQYAAYFAGAAPFLAATYGFAAGRLKYQIQKVNVPISGLPKALDGLKIVQLSDIHIGDFMPPDEIRRAVDMANGLGADLAVITGDFISDDNDPLQTCIAELSRLHAPLGRWGCNGNHEIYARAEEEAQEQFARYGMKLLRQENAELEFKGQKFNLIGVDYQRDHMTSGVAPKVMLQGLEPLVRSDVPNILLSHNPNSFHRAAELGIELSLAGHTHGGQVKVEIVDHSWSPAKLITKFVAGLYDLPMGNGSACTGKKSFLYVNRGLGTFGMPVRIGVPPEITLLTLRAV